MPRRRQPPNGSPPAKTYTHPEAESLMRPEVGTQGQFRKQLPPQTYSYDPSLSPTLQWAGKAERLSFEVPTLPLFVHERLSTKAIIETLRGHKRDKQLTMFDLFGDPEHPIADQVLKAYEHKDKWVNRLILGDNLAVMNSLLHYEKLGGQVQMIFMDPPYGVRFGSNFQPFVRKHDVKHNDDSDFTREPEMVQAYRDTWELGLHSYLTCLRDRLLLCRELLHPTGSLFLQIGDENLHHAREVLDEIFGKENFCSLISYAKTTTTTGKLLPGTCDFILWYAKDNARVKFRQIYSEKALEGGAIANYNLIELPDGSRRKMTSAERENPKLIPLGARPFRLDNLTSPRIREARTGYYPIQFEGKEYLPRSGEWKTHREGIQKLIDARRIASSGDGLYYVRFLSDFPAYPINNLWDDTVVAGFTVEKHYVVETNPKAVKRCMMMTTDPGDLVLDPTCGSGTTAYVAEQWGRRWITMDVSRVPLALARQRLLTATFPWYDLSDESRGPTGGFVYKRKQNRKGEEVGGIVPHITLKSIANNEPPAEEVLVDRPETSSKITRVTGPFVVEATIPTPADWDGNGRHQEAESNGSDGNFPARMLEVLRKSPVLRLEGNRSVTVQNVRPPAKSLSLSAEAVLKNGADKPVAFVFGPENGAVAEKLVYAALQEAGLKGYSHLYVVGFAIQPNARLLIERSAEMGAVPATYVQATPDLLMGDLLKNMRSSQIFSVCGLPEIEVKRLKNGNGKKGKNGNGKNGDAKYQVGLIGLDVFDPVTMEVIHRAGADVPAWFLDTDYNGLVFHVCQAFFPRTGAWESLKKALKVTHEEAVWDHLAGTTSAPFEAGQHRQVSVKVIDDRGNELQVVKSLDDAR